MLLMPFDSSWWPNSSSFLGAALICGIAVDLWLGDPPNRWHLVAWFGRLMAPLSSLADRESKVQQLVAGIFVATIAPTSVALMGILALFLVESCSGIHFVFSVIVLKSCFAIRGLDQAARGVEKALRCGDLQGAQGALRGLCSRDGAQLDEEEIAAAAIESVAENSSDSLVAPMFYLCILGIPGLLFYRAVNTLDAMFGYRGRFELFGKPVARLDDLLNWVPARASVVFLLISGWLHSASVGGGIRILRRDGAKTASPNAGRPMATMAGMLGVRLIKKGHYVLGESSRRVDVDDLAKARTIARGAMLAAGVAATLYLVGVGG